MQELPPEMQELILKYSTKSMSRLLFYSEEEVEAYWEGFKDLAEFVNELGELHEKHNDDIEFDIDGMGMDEFNQFLRDKLDKGNNK